MRSALLLLGLSASALAFAQSPKRPLNLDDMARIRAVGDPQCSPDGQWVAYTVGHVDTKGDKHVTHIWMASYDGKQNLQMTDGQQSESAPRWSPDGKYLSFTSSRPGAAHGNQVWLLNRAGGEATQLTNVKGSLHSYAWSPDSKTLALVIEDPDPDAPPPDATRTGPPPPPKPIVIDRYKFKEDRIGYLTDRETHIYLFDIASKKLTRLTSGHHDETNPVWSPDGSRIAFFSKHDPHPDRKLDGRIWVIDVRPGAVEHAITSDTDYAEDSRVAWSPDGKQIAFLEGAANQWGAYTMQRLALVAADGSDPAAVIAPGWDRGVSNPTFSADGKAVYVLTADDRNQYPLQIDLAEHTTKRLVDGAMAFNSYSDLGSCDAGLVGYDDRAPEIYHPVPTGKPIELSHQNDALFQQLDLAKVEDISFPSSDGTDVHGLLYLPVGYRAGTRVPFLLRIHGGPNGQHVHSFNFESQFFAAHGYAVLNVNYRGSSGRGEAWQRSIAADWGDLEVKDLEAGVNKVIAMGIADPNHMGVGGWSYGGILTDYMIATDNRFKAATVGAGTAFTVAFYGTDQYIIQYNDEIGPPWEPKAWATYQKISYPFLHADRIKTPTLFLNGDRDFNVPIQGNQNMYEALRTLNIPSEMVIYPGEWHGISRPSFQRDVDQRYLDWYDKYLKGTSSRSEKAKP